MKIAILGYGIEGESSYKYWSQDPSNQITIMDKKTPSRALPDGVSTVIGDNYLDNLFGFDLLVRTTSLNKHQIKTDGKVWSLTNEMFAKCPAQIIGVTGTKGKGTTASMISSIFEAAGKKVWLTGNIGVASLMDLSQIQPDDIVVYELSSFQLWDIERSPHVAVVTIVEPEHLDVHSDLNDYVDAKANIRRFQQDGDVCIYHPTNEYAKRIAMASDKGTAIRFGIPDDGGVYAKDDGFYQNEQKICSIDALQLVGPHNVENACAAVSVAKFYNISDTDIESGLRNFKGLPHRLEFVKEVSGVAYYNDSFSASTPATVAAIKPFTQPEILIVGGVDRGGDFTEVADAIANSSNVKAVIVIGQIRIKLSQLIKNTNSAVQIIVSEAKTMAEIVQKASSLVASGDVVILSPGCGSFDMFRDYYDRGEQFKNEVNKI